MTFPGTNDAVGAAQSEAIGPSLDQDDGQAVLPGVEPNPEVAEPEADFRESSYEAFAPELHKSRAERHQEVIEELSFAENPVAIVEADGLAAMGEAAAARGYLWISLAAPGPQHRGRLGLYIEETIENHLEERGALPPGIHASTGLDSSLSDQLYRARLVEMRGIALGVPTLEGITNLGRCLDAEDSAVLRWWMAATSDRPVRLVISDANTRLRVYPSPVLFDSLLEVAPGSVTPMPASLAMADSAKSMELSDLPPATEAVSETNVFGTEVEKVLHDQQSELNDSSFDDSEYAGEYDDEDVDLPDLDRALGLVPDVVSAAVEAPVAPPRKRIIRSTQPESASQLALDYESPSAPEVKNESHDQAILAQSAPAEEVPDEPEEPETEILEAGESQELATEIEQAQPEAEQALVPAEQTSEVQEELVSATPAVDEHQVEDADEALFAETDELADEDATDLDDLLTEDGEAPSASPTDVFQGAETSGELDELDDDLDTDEFLRTLEEDSARAPMVEPAAVPEAEEPLVEASPEPTPLPTKKIKRNPFIRMAEPGMEPVHREPEAISEEASAEAEQEAAEAVEPAAERSEPTAEATALAGDPAAPEPNPESEAEIASPVNAETPAKEMAANSLTAARALPDPEDSFNQLAAREWKNWVQNLEAARGPKPLSVIERMFVTDYTRLREALRRGVAEPSANAILDEWRDSFTESYSEAFDALRVRGKRPTMVLDLPELATRLGRLQGARRVQLLMVDGLRFDLGLMVQERMRRTAEASLTERLLLWSALPSVTSYQLELLGKGPDGLKEPGDIDEPPALVARGKSALTPRRVRTGSLELLKLDVVADSLRQPGPPMMERMEDIADRTADAIVDHMSKQAPRTMVVVFGDHGFALDPKSAGTTEEVKQGGATPEEILVPAFAWLTGAVH